MNVISKIVPTPWCIEVERDRLTISTLRSAGKSSYHPTEKIAHCDLDDDEDADTLSATYTAIVILMNALPEIIAASVHDEALNEALRRKPEIRSE